MSSTVPELEQVSSDDPAVAASRGRKLTGQRLAVVQPDQGGRRVGLARLALQAGLGARAQSFRRHRDTDARRRVVHLEPDGSADGAGGGPAGGHAAVHGAVVRHVRREDQHRRGVVVSGTVNTRYLRYIYILCISNTKFQK